jgi:hypothetical protein
MKSILKTMGAFLRSQALSLSLGSYKVFRETSQNPK